ncbi:N/A [soil metagenome]
MTHLERTVSVVMIFLDGERFLEEAIRSVVEQTYPHWEILLIDDGSHDRSTGVARRFAAEWPNRIRYFEHPGHANRGMSASRNVGIRHARGAYLAFLDYDDVWLRTKLERQVAVLEANPEASMTYGPMYLWYGWTGDAADAKRDFVWPPGGWGEQLVQPPAMLLRNILQRDGLPAPCGVLVRRETAERVGGFEETFPGMYEDEVFFSKIALQSPVYLIPDIHERYRQHPESFCARAMARGEFDPNLPNPSRERYLKWLTAYLAKMGLDDGTLGPALQAELMAYRDGPASSP